MKITMRLPKGKLILLLCILAASVLFAVACDASVSPDQPPDQGGQGAPAGSANQAAKAKTELVLQLEKDPSMLLPQYTGNIFDMNMCYNIFDNLVECNFEDMQNLVYSPSLAKSWDISADGMEYVFHLRDDVKFHNGDSFGADDVVFSLNYAKNSSYTTSKLFMMERAEAVDPYTVRVVLKSPYTKEAFLGLLASPQLGISSKRVMEEYGETEKSTVGTGAYKLDRYTIGSEVVLVANEGYFKGAPPIKKITFRIMGDNNTAFIAFRNGEVDEFQNGGKLDIDAVASNPDIQITRVIRSSSDLMLFNSSVPALSDFRVRQAITHAVDIESVTLAISDGLYMPSNMIFSDIHPGCDIDDYVKYPYDPAAAKALLAEAGYDSRNPLTIGLLYTTTSVGTKFATAIQAALSAVGINCIPEAVDGSQYSGRLLNHEYEMAYMRYNCTPYNPLNSVGQVLKREGGSYYVINLHDAYGDEIENLLVQAYSQVDFDAQLKNLRDAIRLCRKYCADLPCATPISYVMTNSKLAGMNYDPVCLFTKYYKWHWMQ